MLGDTPLAAQALALQEEISEGLKKFATVEHPVHGTVYACEVDGMGNYLLMDDANIPSLISAPYLGYTTTESNTSCAIFSKVNLHIELFFVVSLQAINT